MSGRPLLAARGSSVEGSRDAADQHSPAPTRPAGRAKRTLIESACSACRRRKSRCDGQRPTCSRCQNLRTECQYEAEEGESRWSALRRRNQLLEAERDQLRELLAFVQMRPEPEALDIFARIRQTPYDDLFLLLRQIKDGALTMAGALAPYPGAPPPASMSPAGSTTAPDHRLPLPPIQSILNVGGNSSNRDMQPASLVHSQSLSSEDSRGSHGSMDGNIGSVTPHPHNHRLLDTLEPSLRGNANNPPTLATPQLTLSSEESTGSVNSTSMDAPPKPYHTP